MSRLLICILTLSVFWKGGHGQFPQFSFSHLHPTTIASRLPDYSSSLILKNQAENISSSTPLSTTEVVSHGDSGTSNPPTTTTPSMETVTPPIAATNISPSPTPAGSGTHAMLTTEATNATVLLSTAVTDRNTMLTTATSNAAVLLSTAVTDRNTMLTTATTNPTVLLSTAVTDRNTMLTTATTNTTVLLSTAVTDRNTMLTTGANDTNVISTTAATNVKPALTLAVDKTNAHTENHQERSSPSANGTAATTRRPSATSARTRSKEREFKSPDEWYSYDEDSEEEAKPASRGDVPKCRYDPCEHLQRPCLETSQGRCMCPGLTTDSEAPGRPLSVSAEDVTASSAEVRWCAPHSSVSGYELRVREKKSGALVGREPVLDLDHTFRRFRLTDLRESRAYTACVVAKNRAGSSPALCAELVTARGVSAVTRALGAAVGGLGMLAVALAVCLCHQCRKPPAENRRDTSLISIPNPAYCHPQDTAEVLKV